MNLDWNLLRCCQVQSPERQCLLHRDDNRRIGLLATAYQSLSAEEQLRVNRDLYGTETPILETPELVERKLEDLDRELCHIHEEKKRHYTQAISMEKKLLQDGGEEYVGSPKFRLMFLRAELFDASLAARRLIRYFHEKYDMFGEDKLARKIKQADLNDEEKEALHSGAISFVGTTDLSGRPVVLGRRSIALTFNPISIKRTFFYLFQKVIEGNETAQKKGIIVVGDNMGEAKPDRPSSVRSMMPVIRMKVYALPIRLAGLHNYYFDLKEHFIMNLILVVVPREYRARVLAHYLSSYEECMASLMEYGIDPNTLPLMTQGESRYEMIRDYWERERQLEQ